MTYKTRYIIRSIRHLGTAYYTSATWSGLIGDAKLYPSYADALDALDILEEGIYSIDKIFIR